MFEAAKAPEQTLWMRSKEIVFKEIGGGMMELEKLMATPDMIPEKSLSAGKES